MKLIKTDIFGDISAHYNESESVKSGKCEKFYQHFDDFKTLFFYVNLGKQVPTGISVQQVNAVNNTTATVLGTTNGGSLNGIKYLFGKDYKDDYYVVITNIQPSLSNESLCLFYLLVTIDCVPDPLFSDSKPDFITEQYSCDRCDDLNLLSACYGSKEGKGLGYYDQNEVYYGSPKEFISGTEGLVYKHQVYVKEDIILQKTRSYTTVISGNKVSAADYVIEHDISLADRDYPPYYIKILESILSRGEILYKNETYVVNNFVTKLDCCGGYIIGATKISERVEFDCGCYEFVPTCKPPNIITINNTNAQVIIVVGDQNNSQYSMDNGTSWIDFTGAIILNNLPAGNYVIKVRNRCSSGLISLEDSGVFNIVAVPTSGVFIIDGLNLPSTALDDPDFQSMSLSVQITTGGTVIPANMSSTPVLVTGVWQDIAPINPIFLITSSRVGTFGDIGPLNSYSIALYVNGSLQSAFDWLDVAPGQVISNIVLTTPIINNGDEIKITLSTI